MPISLAGTAGYILNGMGQSVSNGDSEFITSEYVLGFVYLPAVVCISITSFFLAPLGARLAHSLPVPVVKKLFAIMLILLCIDMIYALSKNV